MNKLITILILLLVLLVNTYGFINTNSFVNNIISNNNRLKRIIPLINIKNNNIVNNNNNNILNNNIILNGISVSLDKSIVPSTGVKLQKATLFIFLTYLTYRLLNNMIQGKFGIWTKRKTSQILSVISEKLEVFLNILDSINDSFNLNIYPLFKLVSRVISAKTMALFDSVSNFLDFDPEELIDIKDWKVCSLYERENLSGGYMRYRFEMGNEAGVLPLYIGQELQMCAIDSKDRVYKESVFPISGSKPRGYFDIILKREKEGDDSFSKALDSIPLGDELAFKAGKYRLKYTGEDGNINSVTLVASGLGIAPAIQIIRGILPDRQSTVDDMELLWVNEDEKDFICTEDVESLEYRFIEKFYTTRVTDEDLYGLDFTKNDKILGSLSPFKKGRIAVICAQDFIATKARKLFLDIGYPMENILTIVTAS